VTSPPTDVESGHTPRAAAPQAASGQGGAFRRTLGTPKIVFLVIAAAAPLAAVVGTVPLSFAIGNGVGVPAMFVFAGLTLLCFSVGYAAMSRRIVNAGGFYSYLAAGLGRPVAVAGGLLAVVAYNAAAIGLAGAFAYFGHLVFAQAGLNVPWQVWGAAGILLMAFLGYRQIDVSARVLAVLMVGEVTVLGLLDIAVLIRRGGAALPAASFSPGAILAPGIGVSLMFALVAFVGFESAALYGEESRNPRRSVPLATYLSVIVIAVFYALTSWVAVGAVGPDRLKPEAGRQLGNLFFGLTTSYLGDVITAVMGILLCTSLFASLLAIHNAANRYMFVLGRDGVLPAALGSVHRRRRSPHRASLTQTACTVVVVGVFAIAGLDPYVNLATAMTGLGTLGIILLQASAAAAVIGFFRRRSDRHWWRTLLAPALGFLGLATSTVLVVRNYGLLTGSSSPVVNALPLLLLLVALGGVGYAYRIRSRRSDQYATLAAVEHREPPEPLRSVADAGPSPVPAEGTDAADAA
jgi:amino acid transporter